MTVSVADEYLAKSADMANNAKELRRHMQPDSNKKTDPYRPQVGSSGARKKYKNKRELFCRGAQHKKIGGARV